MILFTLPYIIAAIIIAGAAIIWLIGIGIGLAIIGFIIYLGLTYLPFILIGGIILGAIYLLFQGLSFLSENLFSNKEK